MSLYGVLRTGVSGMTAQSNKLGTIADNVANSATNGYKRASTEFSSLIPGSSKTSYGSGAVVTNVRYSIAERGPLAYTSSGTDLAVQGNGFFLVSDPKGTPYLTRAGSFVLDGATGNLVNAGGFTLMGYDISGGDPASVLNGPGGLVPVNVSGMNLQATPSTRGTFAANLPYGATPVAGDTPADNLATSDYTAKSSIVTYDNVGNPVTLDVYFTKTSGTTWEMQVFNKADADPATGGFPYGAAGSAPLGTQTLTFNGSGDLVTAPPTLSLTVPNGSGLTLDLSGMSHLAADYTPMDVEVNGNAPSSVTDVVIDKDGTVYAAYENGARVPAFRIPLANVPSPDNLMPMAGNVFVTTTESGDYQIGTATKGGLGSIISGAVEQSNVDMASELTEMIVAQRDYQANSKVFQTGSELLDVLMNLKR